MFRFRDFFGSKSFVKCQIEALWSKKRKLFCWARNSVKRKSWNWNLEKSGHSKDYLFSDPQETPNESTCLGAFGRDMPGQGGPRYYPQSLWQLQTRVKRKQTLWNIDVLLHPSGRFSNWFHGGLHAIHQHYRPFRWGFQLSSGAAMGVRSFGITRVFGKIANSWVWRIGCANLR